MVPETVEKTQDTVPYENMKYSDWSEKTRALKFNDEHCQPLLLICCYYLLLLILQINGLD